MQGLVHAAGKPCKQEYVSVNLYGHVQIAASPFDDLHLLRIHGSRASIPSHASTMQYRRRTYHFVGVANRASDGFPRSNEWLVGAKYPKKVNGQQLTFMDSRFDWNGAWDVSIIRYPRDIQLPF